MNSRAVRHTIDVDLDAITAERDRVMRWPDGDAKFARMADLFGREAELWKSLFSVSTSRTHARAAIRAAQYATGEAKRWTTRVVRPVLVAPREDPDFRASGNCAKPGVDPDVFFDDGRGSRSAARRICTGCPVYTECLEYAVETDEQGVWAATSQRERRAIRGKRRSQSRAQVA